MSVKSEIDEAVYDALHIVGTEISQVINQSSNNATDTEVVSQIVTILKHYKIYKEQ